MCDFLKNSEINLDQTHSCRSVEEIFFNEKNNVYNDYEEYENDNLISYETQDEITDDEKIITNKNHNNLPFTNILKILKNNKLDRDYKKWIRDNEELVKSAYYIIQTKYLNDININNISLYEFSIFCFLSN